MRNVANVAIIGAGVSGLTSGIELLEAGYKVTILARELPPNTTSNAAAAFWFSYRALPEDKVLKWSGISLQRFKTLYSHPKSGVFPVKLVQLLKPDDKAPTWAGLITGSKFAPKDSLPPAYTNAYEGEVPSVDTSYYMPFLLAQFASKGGLIRQIDIKALTDIRGDYSIIVNCSGVFAGALVKDSAIKPIRGQALRVTKPNCRPCAWVDTDGPLGLTFIVPRVNDYVVGGTAEDNNWNLTVDQESSNAMLRRASQIEPALKECEILDTFVGLRPGRSEVRVELEKIDSGPTIIHNYGHAGGGFTLSWGCAAEVVELAQASL